MESCFGSTQSRRVSSWGNRTARCWWSLTGRQPSAAGESSRTPPRGDLDCRTTWPGRLCGSADLARGSGMAWCFRWMAASALSAEFEVEGLGSSERLLRAEQVHEGRGRACAEVPVVRLRVLAP